MSRAWLCFDGACALAVAGVSAGGLDRCNAAVLRHDQGRSMVRAIPLQPCRGRMCIWVLDLKCLGSFVLGIHDMTRRVMHHPVNALAGLYRED